jgi:hypothetical protein
MTPLALLHNHCTSLLHAYRRQLLLSLTDRDLERELEEVAAKAIAKVHKAAAASQVCCRNVELEVLVFGDWTHVGRVFTHMP